MPAYTQVVLRVCTTLEGQKLRRLNVADLLTGVQPTTKTTSSLHSSKSVLKKKEKHIDFIAMCKLAQALQHFCFKSPKYLRHTEFVTGALEEGAILKTKRRTPAHCVAYILHSSPNEPLTSTSYGSCSQELDSDMMKCTQFDGNNLSSWQQVKSRRHL